MRKWGSWIRLGEVELSFKEFLASNARMHLGLLSIEPDVGKNLFANKQNGFFKMTVTNQQTKQELDQNKNYLCLGCDKLVRLSGSKIILNYV
jgi:hypothetical protein